MEYIRYEEDYYVTTGWMESPKSSISHYDNDSMFNFFLSTISLFYVEKRRLRLSFLEKKALYRI